MLILTPFGSRASAARVLLPALGADARPHPPALIAPRRAARRPPPHVPCPTPPRCVHCSRFIFRMGSFQFPHEFICSRFGFSNRTVGSFQHLPHRESEFPPSSIRQAYGAKSLCQSGLWLQVPSVGNVFKTERAGWALACRDGPASKGGERPCEKLCGHV